MERPLDYRSQTPVLHITPADRVALQLLANGTAAIEIANNLGLPEAELESHLTTLFARLGAASRSEAIAIALKRGLLTTSELTYSGS
jgi:NarL family two-component system response regulator YdfI